MSVKGFKFGETVHQYDYRSLINVPLSTRLGNDEPLYVNTVAKMTDNDRIYVYTGSETGYTTGGWYYYNGNTWINGGIYYVEDNTPYIYRQTGGDTELSGIDGVGDRLMEDNIVGGSVVGNQLIKNGNFDNSTSYWLLGLLTATVQSNVVTLTATGAQTAANINQSLSLTSGHKYLFSLSVNPSATNRIQYDFYNGSTFDGKTIFEASAGTWTVQQGVYNATIDAIQVYIRPNLNGLSGYSCQMKNVMLFDLTAMFGTTIADYINTLETATAGSGAAWLKANFPKIFNSGYVPYNAGEIVSVQGLSQHVTVGFNQWDEEWESGIYDANGLPVANASLIRSKNFIPVLSDTAYFMKTPAGQNRICFYDANKNFIMRSDLRNVDTEFTTIAGCHYIKFHIDGTTYNHDICINLSDPSRNGEYEPYQKRTYPLDSSLTLRGIPKLTDSNGSGDVLSIIDTINLYYDGDRYLPDGTVQRRYGIVDLGTLNWAYNSTTEQFRAGLEPFPAETTNSTVANAICTQYPIVSYISMADKTASVFFASLRGVNIKDSAYTDAATFKSAMSGVYLVYELAAPTTESADPFQSPQIVDPDGTEEYVSTSVIPVGHESRYQKRNNSIPAVTTSDNGKMLQVVNGQWAAVSIPNANGGAF